MRPRRTWRGRRPGCTTPVFQRNSKANARFLRSPDLCFSIVTSARTLDLQCDSAGMRNTWVAAFAAVCRRQQQQRAGGEGLHA